MLKYDSVKTTDLDLTLRVIHVDHRDEKKVERFNVNSFPHFIINDPELSVFERINYLFEEMSEFETDRWFVVVEELKMLLIQNHRKDELNGLFNRIGDRLVNEFDKMSIMANIRNTMFARDFNSVRVGHSDISFIRMSAIIKILFPIIVCVYNKSKQYSTNSTINNLAIVRILRPIFNSYFDKEQTAIRKWIIEYSEEVFPTLKDHLSVDPHLKTLSLFCEAFWCDIVSNILLKCPLDNKVIFEEIKECLNLFIITRFAN